MITIGITGTIGAGKGTMVEYLVSKGFKHYSARAFFIRELNKRGLELTRDNMLVVANGLRKEFFPGYTIAELMKEAKADGTNAVIESIRSVGEIDILRQSGEAFHLFAVDADLELRYQRILARKLTTDHVTFEKFMEDERKETENNEPWASNLRACIKAADVVIENNGSVEEFQAKIDVFLNKILA